MGLSLLEWRFYYFHMFRNPLNQFMQLNPFPAVETFTWTGAERHAWRSRYWRSRGQIVYRRNRRNGARLLQRTLMGLISWYKKIDFFISRNRFLDFKKSIFWYQNIDVLISKNQFLDIRNHFWYQEINGISWYQKFIFWYKKKSFLI